MNSWSVNQSISSRLKWRARFALGAGVWRSWAAVWAQTAAAVTLFGAVASSAWAQVQLVTDEEARRPDAKTALTRAITRGPGVKLASPETVKASGFALKVEFESRGGKRIDPATVKVEYLKEPVVDVTERVKAGVRADAVEISQVLLPPGDHSFRVTVADIEGRRGSAVFSLKARR